MSIEKDEKTVLSEKYATFVLISLMKNGETNLDRFKSVITVLPTLKNLMNALENDDLVKCRVVIKPRKTTFYSLTERGLEVAKALHMAEQIRSGERATVGIEPMDCSTSPSEGNKVT